MIEKDPQIDQNSEINQLQNSGDEELQQQTPPKKRRPWWKRLLLWLIGIVGGIILLLTILTGLLYVPAIQDWIVESSISKAEEATGWDLEIGQVRVGFPLKLNIQGVRAKDPKNNTIIGEVENLTADVSIIPFIKGGALPISGIKLDNALMDYTFPNDSLYLRATVGQLRVKSYDIDLKTLVMNAQELKLRDADVDIRVLVDSVPSNKPKKPSTLVIYFDHAELANLSSDILILPDSILVSAQINEGDVVNGEVNIEHSYYQADKIDLKAKLNSVGADISFIPMPWLAEISATKARYGGPHDIRANVHHLKYETGDGWKVLDGRMKAKKDSINFKVDDLYLKLPQSTLSGYAYLPFNTWIPDSTGVADVRLKGKINPTEVDRFVGGLEGIPDALFDLDLKAQGNMERQVELELDLKRKHLVELFLQADAQKFFSKKERKLTAHYDIRTGEELMGSVINFLNKGKKAKAPSWNIPAGIRLDGKAFYTTSKITADFLLVNEWGNGDLDASLVYKPLKKEYFADLKINEFAIESILPKDSIGTTSASIKLKGLGTDLYSPRTTIDIEASIDSTSYKGYPLKEITLLSKLHENELFAAIDSPNDALKMTAQMDATLHKNEVVGSINVFVDTIIPSQLGLKLSIIEAAKLELRSNLRSDLKERHEFSGEIENFYITTDKNKIHPTNTYVIANTSSDAMSGEVTSGDLSLKFESSNGLNDFSSRIKKVIENVKVSLADSLGQMNMGPWIEHYPNMKVDFTMGRNNLLRAYLDEYRIGARSASLNLTSTTGEGLSGMGVVSYLQADTFRIDNIDLVLQQDSNFFTAVTTVHKEKFRNQPPFDILLSLSSNVKRSEAYLNWLDSDQKQFINLGLELWNKSNGDLTFGFTPDPLVLAYNTFNVANEDYVTLPKGKLGELDADIELVSPDGASILIKAMPNEKGHLTKANIKDLKLSQLEGIEFIPNLKGILNVDIDWLQLPGKVSQYNGKLTLDEFAYEGKSIGSLQMYADAKSSTPGEINLNSIIHLNNSEVITAKYFKPAKVKKGEKFAIAIQELPLEKANPFLPSYYATLTGWMNGEVSNFDTRLPIAEAQRRAYSGEVRFRDAEWYAEVANETYQLDSRPIAINGGKVRLNQFALSANNRQMTIDGTVDLENNLKLDLRLTGEDILLLNSEQTRNSMFFGIVNADADLHLSGPVRAMKIRGNLDLLGSTNVTYQSKKSELQNRNHFKDLVEFTDFTDTLFLAKKSAVDSLSLGGMDIRLGVHIDPATKLNAILTRDGSNRVSIQGGGDFNLLMPPYGDMNLSGTYDIQEGDIFMNIATISRKFTINKDSRIIWTGNILEPRLDFKATSRIKSTVSTPGEPSRQIDFDVNIIAEDRLDRLKLRFETEAVQDLAMRNLLAGMSPEEQNRQSITLLTTGLFLNTAGTETRGFDVNSSLTSLLSSQINSLAGEALNAEINFGISDGTNAFGQGTNYSYSITKSFYNDRISLTVGGKMVTGQAASGLRQSFIDNISLDYRLDKAGTHYLRFFHNKNYENLLDGEVIETGAGYVIRRRLVSLSDLFKFNTVKRKRSILEDQPNDSIPSNTISNAPLILPEEKKINDLERNEE